MEKLLTDLIFSIAVPIGSYHPRLAWALRSLFAQGVKLRVAALDASGDPRVAALLDEYSQLFHYRRCGPDKGQAAAIEEGWSNLGGDILGWLNADDFLYPGALSAAEANFRKTGADIVTGDSVFLDGDGRFWGHHPGLGPADERILTSNPISQPSTFVRRSAIQAVGGINTELNFTMDWDLWVRLLRSGAHFVKDSNLLSGVTIEAGTKTMRFGAERRAEISRILNQQVSKERWAKTMFAMALQYLDDRTSLVSYALDLAGSQRDMGDQESKIIARRRFLEAATIGLAHFDERLTRELLVSCEEIPLGVEWEASGAPKLRLEWPGNKPTATFPITISSGSSGRLKIIPRHKRGNRVFSIAMKF